MMKTVFKNISFVFFLASVTSCAGKKVIPTVISGDEYTKQYYQAFNAEKNTFLVSDSAQTFLNDLGWVKRLTTDALFSKDKLPSVFRNETNKDYFTIEFPCWEQNHNNDNTVANVVTEHACLDSAIIYAKIQGVDEIYRNTAFQEIAHYNDNKKEYVLDSIIISNSYGNYIQQAKFTCMFIMRTKKSYIVNATIKVENKYPTLYFDEK